MVVGLKFDSFVGKSPAVSHMTASLHGLTTIRAFNMESQFEAKFCSLLNVHSSTCFFQLICAKWIGVTIQSLAFFYFVCVTLAFVLDTDAGKQIVKYYFL